MLSRFKSLGLGTRIISVTLVILVAVVAVNYVVFVSKYKADATEAMVEKAASFTAVADEAKNHVANLVKEGAFDTEGLLVQLKADLAAAQEAAQRENIDFPVTAYEARNKENELTHDPFEVVVDNGLQRPDDKSPRDAMIMSKQKNTIDFINRS